jgi:SdpI/YfhL protein family
MNATIPFLVACGVIALVSIPLILKIVPPNRWYGFRTTRTLSNEDLWFRANCIAGWAFLAAAGTTAAILVLAPEVASGGYGALVLAVSIGIALIITVVYVRNSSVVGETR